MDKKPVLIIIGCDIPASVLAKVTAEHIDHEIIVRTPEEHAVLAKQEKIFEREPIKFEAPELFINPTPKPYFGEVTSPIDAIGKRNKFGRHKHW